LEASCYCSGLVWRLGMGWDGMWNYTMEFLFAVVSIDSS
jgi:hypothetical protein